MYSSMHPLGPHRRFYRLILSQDIQSGLKKLKAELASSKHRARAEAAALSSLHMPASFGE